MDGHVDKVKGRIKQAAGLLTDNKQLKDEGEADELRGNVKVNIDKAANTIKKLI